MNNIETHVFILVIIFFVAVIPFVGRSNAKISGWAKLAKKYPATEAFEGSTSPFRSMIINDIGYFNAVTVGINNTHLYLKYSFIFDFGAKPLLIPFTAIKAKQMGWDLTHRVLLTIDNVQFDLSKKDADKMVKASKGAWNYQKQ